MGADIAGPAGHQPTHESPAAQPDVLSVSALAADDDELASFSNSGDWIDVAAPGESIAGPVPGGRYSWWAGTSIAAPFVAGQAALIHAEAPKLKASQIRDVIAHTSTHMKDHAVHDGIVDILGSLTASAPH